MEKTLKIDTTTLSWTTGKILVLIVTGESAPQSADLPIPLEDLVAEMLYCYIQSAKCTRFHAASTSGAKLINQILPLYVSVHRAPNAATTLTGQLLALLTGEKLSDMNETTCYKNRLAWMGGYNFTEICINSTVNYSIAVSPAFIIDGLNIYYHFLIGLDVEKTWNVTDLTTGNNMMVVIN
ncbi:nicastrin isoform X4 [Ooceraea biroi]|uniref:nicastrin isoform X4 n=1 Tax=Ooceraea biroi TaxID=2015173 RepID=UPI000F08D1DF|nr:nicastrin isoform X4 [Ooceraea biroi]